VYLNKIYIFDSIEQYGGVVEFGNLHCNFQLTSILQGLGFWCLAPLSTIFQVIVAVSFIGGGNWSILRKNRPAASH